MSDVLAGTSLKPCEPEVNNSRMGRAVGLTCAAQRAFITIPNRLMSQCAVKDGPSSSFNVHVANTFWLLRNREAGRVWHTTRWAAFYLLNNGLLISPCHRSATIAMHFIVREDEGERQTGAIRILVSSLTRLSTNHTLDLCGRWIYDPFTITPRSHSQRHLGQWYGLPGKHQEKLSLMRSYFINLVAPQGFFSFPDWS